MSDASTMEPLQDGKFHFACHKEMPCFTRCCANLTLLLTPYDILRLKHRLHLCSDEFLDRYTDDYIDETTGLPVVRLKMRDDETRRCPFVSSKGCAVYEDRPGACRLYPLARAASRICGGDRVGEHYFLIKESHCLGLNEGKEWTVEAWLTDQGLAEYNTMNDSFMDISTTRSKKTRKNLSQRQLQMYYMACYNLEGFRRFIFESTFLKRFDITGGLLHRIQTDDVQLLAFARRWLKFSLYGEMTLQVKHRPREQAPGI